MAIDSVALVAEPLAQAEARSNCCDIRHDNSGYLTEAFSKQVFDGQWMRRFRCRIMSGLTSTA